MKVYEIMPEHYVLLLNYVNFCRITGKHYTSLKKLARDKRSSLFGPFLSYEEYVLPMVPFREPRYA
jgi:hypothetical protein